MHWGLWTEMGEVASQPLTFLRGMKERPKESAGSLICKWASKPTNEHLGVIVLSTVSSISTEFLCIFSHMNILQNSTTRVKLRNLTSSLTCTQDPVLDAWPHTLAVCVSTVVTLQGLFPRITLGKRRDYLFLPVPLGWNSVSLALISVCKIVFCCWEKSQEWCILLSAVSGDMWGPSVLPLPETLVIWLRWCFLRFLYDRVSILSSWKPRSIFRVVFWETNFLFLFEVHLLSLAFYV